MCSTQWDGTSKQGNSEEPEKQSLKTGTGGFVGHMTMPTWWMQYARIVFILQTHTQNDTC